ncbi:hypothetical protein WDU94_007506 [Cyamophila willieti]
MAQKKVTFKENVQKPFNKNLFMFDKKNMKEVKVKPKKRFSPQTLGEMLDMDKVLQAVTKNRRKQVDSFRRSCIMGSLRAFSTHPFCDMTVQNICHRVFKYHLKKDTRFPGVEMCFVLSTTIRDTIKWCKFERYKSAVIVDMIEKPLVHTDGSSEQRTRPSFISVHRMQCDMLRDHWVTYTWENDFMAASAIVFGFFIE